MRELEIRKKVKREPFVHTTVPPEYNEKYKSRASNLGVSVGDLLVAMMDYHESLDNVKKGKKDGQGSKGKSS
jgi:hypothetical protein